MSGLCDSGQLHTNTNMRRHLSCSAGLSSKASTTHRNVFKTLEYDRSVRQSIRPVTQLAIWWRIATKSCLWMFLKKRLKGFFCCWPLHPSLSHMQQSNCSTALGRGTTAWMRLRKPLHLFQAVLASSSARRLEETSERRIPWNCKGLDQMQLPVTPLFLFQWWWSRGKYSPEPADMKLSQVLGWHQRASSVRDHLLILFASHNRDGAAECSILQLVIPVLYLGIWPKTDLGKLFGLQFAQQAIDGSNLWLLLMHSGRKGCNFQNIANLSYWY